MRGSTSISWVLNSCKVPLKRKLERGRKEGVQASAAGHDSTDISTYNIVAQYNLCHRSRLKISLRGEFSISQYCVFLPLIILSLYCRVENILGCYHNAKPSHGHAYNSGELHLRRNVMVTAWDKFGFLHSDSACVLSNLLLKQQLGLCTRLYILEPNSFILLFVLQMI